MKENSTNDLIRAYLGGKLPSTEREQLEKMMLNDPELAAQVALQRAEAAAAELLIADETRQLFQQWQSEKPRQHALFRSGPLRWAVGMAAALLLVCAMWQILRPAVDAPMPSSPAPTQPPADLPATPPASAPQPPIAGVEQNPPAKAKGRSSNHLTLAQQLLQDSPLTNLRQTTITDSTASIFQKAQQAYASGDYSQTLALLVQADAAQQQSATFLMAHTLFQLGRFRDAAEQFDRLIAQNSRQYRYRSEWGLLMCRLADRPRSETAFQNQLKEILAQPEHPCFQQATALRDALK